jgi:transporter family-2 protein
MALLAGLAGSVQAAVMGRFGERVGLVEALAWVTLLSVAIAFCALLVTRRGLGSLAEAWTAPKWLWLGAVLGTFVVFTITLASPRIGTAATIGLLVAGQLAAGAVIDRYGLFGFEKIALKLAARARHRPARSRRGADAQAVSSMRYSTQSTVTGAGKAPSASPRRSSSETAERPSSP